MHRVWQMRFFHWSHYTPVQGPPLQGQPPLVGNYALPAFNAAPPAAPPPGFRLPPVPQVRRKRNNFREDSLVFFCFFLVPVLACTTIIREMCFILQHCMNTCAQTLYTLNGLFIEPPNNWFPFNNNFRAAVIAQDSSAIWLQTEAPLNHVGTVQQSDVFQQLHGVAAIDRPPTQMALVITSACSFRKQRELSNTTLYTRFLHSCEEM